MIETDKRKAVFLLHQEGMSVREITRRLGLSRNTVRAISAGKGVMPVRPRRDKQQIDPQLLRSLHEQCRGRIQRMHEKLVEEEGIGVSYSTLTAMLRESGITQAQKTRCHRVPDEPGVEMQHDTTLYSIRLGDKKHKIIASLLYLRYSKRRYTITHQVFGFKPRNSSQT
jgi:transposase